jgi:hypothetical protein
VRPQVHMPGRGTEGGGDSRHAPRARRARCVCACVRGRPRACRSRTNGEMLRAPRSLLLLLLRLAWPACARHNEQPSPTGLWKIPTGFRAYHLDTQLATSVASLLGRGTRNVSLLDMGAGKGLYVRLLRTVGMRNVTGYEGVTNIEELTSGRIKQSDFTVPFQPCKQFDVVMCLEVAEHIPAHLEQIFLSNINCSAGQGLIISWAPPGQGGTGHVNLRSRQDALARLKALGFELDTMATRHIREQATLKWFRENTMALGRRGKPSPFQAPLRLVAEARPESIALQQHEKRTRLEAPSQLPLDAETLARALDRIRAGYAKLEARLDELKLTGPRALKVDVLLNNALAEQQKGFDQLAHVGRPMVRRGSAPASEGRD